MKRYWILSLDWFLRHLMCFKTSFEFNYKYEKEIHNTYIEPITKLVGNLNGDYKYEIVWSKPPRWYKKWMYKIENLLAQTIYYYLLKNKKYIVE